MFDDDYIISSPYFALQKKNKQLCIDSMETV